VGAITVRAVRFENQSSVLVLIGDDPPVYAQRESLHCSNPRFLARRDNRTKRSSAPLLVQLACGSGGNAVSRGAPVLSCSTAAFALRRSTPVPDATTPDTKNRTHLCPVYNRGDSQISIFFG